MYCKVCHCSFNTGDNYVQIGNIAVCGDCAFKTTVRDLVAKGVFPVITMDEEAIPVDYVVDGESGLETRSETPDIVHSKSRFNPLTLRDFDITDPNNAFAVLFTDVSDRQRYYIFPNAEAFEKELPTMYNLIDVHTCSLDSIPSDYSLELDFRPDAADLAYDELRAVDPAYDELHAVLDGKTKEELNAAYGMGDVLPEENTVVSDT